MPLSLPTFVERWKASTLSERAASHSHFINLCEVLGQPPPAEADQTGDTFTFEKHVSTLDDGKGFADVWKKGYFGWEYKGKHKSLSAAYSQLVRYQGDLENPPLLVTCDQERFEVHTNFTGTRPLVYSFTLSDLLNAVPTANCALPPLEVLRAVFTNPDLLRPEASQIRVTEHVAEEFAKLADSLERRNVHPEKAAHFLMRLLFCLFADSIDLLPDHLFRRMIAKPENFERKLRQLFAAMASKGSTFGPHDIHYFNGGLFADDEVFELTPADLTILKAAAALDWSQIEPAIFGTLFERGLDPGKRSQLGAHHTSREDILLIVEPVVIEPLQRRWAAVKNEALALAETAEKERKAEASAKKKGTAYPKLRKQMQDVILDWVDELSKIRVLDPACGSGNFLYLALRRMLDLWHEVRVFCAAHGLPTFLEKQVHPSQLYGLEVNVYAQELASVVVWIGYLQWLKQNAIGWPTEPILRRLDNIQHRDAILTHDANGNPAEPQWPKADFIVGNPPFVGGNKIRQELGDSYFDDLMKLYSGRLSGFSDLVCYWFEKARKMLEQGSVRRVGLLATQGIRGGVNRRVLERIKETGDIFMAWSDRDWLLDGAMVHVSFVGFDNGSQLDRMLDGELVRSINADLTSDVNVAAALPLAENGGMWAYGSQQKGKFDVTPSVAATLLGAPNPFGRASKDVVKRSINGKQLLQQHKISWVIDFGESMSAQEAALYEVPFEYVKEVVFPKREHHKEKIQREKWWLHARPSPKYRKILATQDRYLATSVVSKHRVFVWLDNTVLVDHQIVVFAFRDDYYLGVLQSSVHEIWTRRLATQVRDSESGCRYTPQSTFETFPFPWPPGSEPNKSPLVKAIAEAARELVEKRNAWLKPSDATAADLKKRTLTNLYNARPAWLTEEHRKLDRAVFAAYGWPSTLTDAELLERLLKLNRERAA
jgi:type II restriction/modification system DNA methylase subunit YeeA